MTSGTLKAISFFTILCLPIAVTAGTKIDPYLDGNQAVFGFKAQSISRQVSSGANSLPDDNVEVFIKSSDVVKTRENVLSQGGSIHTVSGSILTATIGASQLRSLSLSSDIVFIEASKPVGFKNDVAGAEIGSQEAHEGYNLPQAFRGGGVVIGIIDTGIDYRHPDFADAEGRTRIISIWDQNRGSGPAPGEIEDSFGTECTAQMIAGGSCPLRDMDGHGTHVAGIAAGRDETYSGVAPDANIVVVSYDSSMNLDDGYVDTIFSTKICQAAYYVFAKAQNLGLPAVVNLSLGTHIGAHDGSSLFEQCLAGLIEGSAGRAIVAAAGNEYSSDEDYTGVHAGFDVGGLAAVNFVIRQATNDRIYYVDFWGARGSNISVGLSVRGENPPGASLGFSGQVAPGERRNGTFLNGGVNYIINAGETQSALNGKPHVGITIRLSQSFTQLQNYSFDLVVEGRGSFDAWLFPDKPANAVMFTSESGQRGDNWTVVPGDRIKSVAIPATSPAVIAVSGYTTRNRWDAEPGCCQVSLALGQLLDFSSSGPSADLQATGVKPDIAAPGGMIASALSSDSTPNRLLVMSDSSHALQAGTSMSAPFVSGAAALIFEANPNFTYADVKNILISSAYQDNAVGEAPNERWGFGKLDVLAALTRALGGVASGSFESNPTIGVPDQVSSGSSTSGCSFTGEQGSGNRDQMFLFLIFCSLFPVSCFLFRSLNPHFSQTIVARRWISP